MQTAMPGKAILIIEDDLGIRSAFQELYEGEGYAVHLTANGREALEHLQANVTSLPGLILLDLMMPVMDGPTFLSVLQRDYPALHASIPIFVISAAGGPMMAKVQATGFLKKPLDLDELSTLAAKYCQ